VPRRRGPRLDIRVPDTAFTVYRAVKTGDMADVSTLERGFRSPAARGIPPRAGSVEETNPFVYEGLSAYDDLEVALDHARARRDIGKPIGTHVAVIVLQPGGDYEFAYWGEDPHHLTVRADPVKLREAVTAIVSLDKPA
jgi:hypothetical protein